MLRRYKNVRYEHIAVCSNHTEATALAKNGKTLVALMAHDIPKMLVFSCPCGCGDIVRLNLLPGKERAWSIRHSTARGISVYPSIELPTRCGSHFFIANNTARLIVYD